MVAERKKKNKENII